MKKSVISEAKVYCAENPEKKYTAKLPEQVHEVLIRSGEIANPVITHDGMESIAVSKKDWVYESKFSYRYDGQRIFLRCKGLDTVTDVWLNGEKIGGHKDMYLPFVCDITEKIREHNTLLFYFYSPVSYLEEYRKNRGMEDAIDKSHYIRKATHDYADFLGIKPYFCPIGIFDAVEILSYEDARIEDVQIEYRMDKALTDVKMEVKVKGERYSCQRLSLYLKVTNSDHEVLKQYRQELQENSTGFFERQFLFSMENIRLWWPTGYGSQELYNIEVSIACGDKLLDRSVKRTGFRLVERKGDFDFWMNHKKVRLWGANLVPPDGLTHRFNKERVSALLDMALEANMNTIRLWGGGESYPDELLQIADEKGILLWGEFFHNYGMFPESNEFMELYEKEAEYMISSFRHHPSLLFWCGGNECQMCGEVLWPEIPFKGSKVFELYEKKVREMDSGRYYHLNSPVGGEFCNDPREGDMHGWNNIWYVPYEEYPVLFSENSRVSIPLIHSMRKFIPVEKDFWPEGFVPRRTGYGEELLPPAWMQLAGGPENYRCSPIEQFYDADSPEDLIYQCGSAHGLFMKISGERIKRGRPSGSLMKDRICQGHLIWKLNDTWPMIFSGLIDYNMEPGIAYYYVKRAFSPIQVSIDRDRHLSAWIVNDTGNTFSGKVGVCLIRTDTCKILKQTEQDVEVCAGESLEVINLDQFGMFLRKDLLYSYVKDRNGRIVAANYDFMEIERNLDFPDAKLSLREKDGDLFIQTDQYAHSIELKACSLHTKFGYRFEDNYFDLLPFEEKRVKIITKEKEFKVTAKAHYSSQAAEIIIKKER